MDGLDLIALKQSLTQLTEKERREISAFIVRLGQDSQEWKEETSRRLDEMASGNMTSVSDLRKELGDA